ncbi:MAG: extra-cytoplasmic solute receptor protein, partial [Pseudomonadota bacterium]
MTSALSFSRRSALAALALAAASGRLSAQNTAPVRLIVGVPPGSSTDVVARVVGEALAKSLAQPVIVDNKAGGSGSIATSAFLAAPHDGQTWLMAVNGFFSEAPHTVKLSFDPLKDAKPLVEIGGGGLVLVGDPNLPAKDMRELVSWARTNKGKVSFASYSAGSLSHVLGLLLNKAEGLDMLHVPYKGSPPALQEIRAGLVHVMFDAPPSSLPLIRAGKLRAFAVTSPQRMAALPDVPTLAELGYKDMTRSAWLGVWTT